MKLEVKRYTKRIKGITILEDINLSLHSGKIYGFSGQAGSGKSMLFRAITGLILPSEGDVCLDGTSILYGNVNLRIFGTLIDDPDFYPNLTGFDNLMLLYRVNHRADKSHIMQQLKRVGLHGNAFEKYETYSLSMKQRLKIVQAIMENQKIIILDEAFYGMEEQGVLDCYEILKEEKAKGKLILLSSYQEESLKSICDDQFSMIQGRLLKIQGEDET